MYGSNFYGRPAYISYGGGAGVGSIFSNIFKEVLPLLTQGAKKLIASESVQNLLSNMGDTAVKTGMDFASDVLKGKNVLKSAEAGLETGFKGIKQDLMTALGDSPPAPKSASSPRPKLKAKRKNKTTTNPPAAKKKKGRKDLFE